MTTTAHLKIYLLVQFYQKDFHLKQNSNYKMNIIIYQTQLWYCEICDKKLLLRVNQNILILNLKNTKKHLVLLLKNSKLLNQALM